MTKICDYFGYACKCNGYKAVGNNNHGWPKSFCICGHSKSQHHDMETKELDEIMAKKNKKESAVEKAYYAYFNNISVPMMSIPQIWNDIQKALELPSEQFDTEMKRLVEVWKVR